MVDGSPGIGKTTFLLERMISAIQQGRTIVYAYKPLLSGPCTYYLFRPQKPVLTADSHQPFITYLQEPTTMFLCDSAPVPSDIACPTVVAASAGRRSLYKHLPLYSICYMPLWTRRELLECRHRLYQTVSRKDVIRYHHIWGGNARRVLGFPSIDMANECAAIKLKARVMEVTDVSELARGAGGIAAPEHIAHTLIHLVPDKTYRFVRYELCSKLAAMYIEERQHYLLQQDARVENWLLGLIRDENNRFVGAMLYEAYVLRRLGQVCLSRPGGSWTSQSLTFS